MLVFLVCLQYLLFSSLCLSHFCISKSREKFILWVSSLFFLLHIDKDRFLFGREEKKDYSVNFFIISFDYFLEFSDQIFFLLRYGGGQRLIGHKAFYDEMLICNNLFLLFFYLFFHFLSISMLLQFFLLFLSFWNYYHHFSHLFFAFFFFYLCFYHW